MSKLLLRWILLAFSVVAASYFTRAVGFGFIASSRDFGEFLRLLIGVAILAFLNATLGTVIKLLTLPLTCLTLGLFSLVVNAFILMMAASFNLGFRFDEQEGGRKFMAAFVASLLISAINAIVGSLLPKDDKDERDD
jgi:putative membrane protein